MPSTIAEEKADLRRQALDVLAGMTQEELVRSDELLFHRFLLLPQVVQCRTLFAFWGVPGREPETGRLVQALYRQGKRVALPVMLPQHRLQARLYCPHRPLVPAGFGLLQPGGDCPLVPPEELDLVLVPALCYDRQGNRLGFGGGFYDRWLAQHPRIATVGLCRDLLLLSQLPSEAHDRRVDLVLTQTAVYP